jgi:FkbM family methyltransferase
MSLVEGFKSHYRLFGAEGVFLAAKSRLSRRQIIVEAVAAGIAHPIHLRLRTSDTSLLEEILLNREYDFEPPKPPRTIIDAGANIGLTSVFLANRFPSARIIAVEPDPGNFAVLQSNLASYRNVTAVLAALWGQTHPLRLVDAGTGNWGFQTREVGKEVLGGTVPGVTVDSLMERFGWGHVDLLKIDIEGAEKEVFAEAEKWIDRVGMIIVELHDRLKAGCSEAVFSATTKFVHKVERGETIFLTRSEATEIDGRLRPVQAFNRPPFKIKRSQISAS